MGGLTWLGRHGGAVIAIGVFAGLLVPPFASLLRPLLVPAILAPFLIALLRIDWRQLRGRLGRPAEIAAALLWLLLISPALVHLVLVPLALPEAIHSGLVLMAAAPPLMASGYLALMLGLDAALAVTLTLLSTALMPFTLPFVGLYLLEVEIDVPLGDLMLRLALVVGGTLALAWLLRRLLPEGFSRRHAEPLDGLAVLGLLVFAIAIMDGVSALLLRQPGFVLACALAVYAFNVGLQTAGQPRLRLARPARRPHARPVQRQRQSRPAAGSARRSRLVRAVRVRGDGAAADLHLAGDPAPPLPSLAGPARGPG